MCIQPSPTIYKAKLPDLYRHSARHLARISLFKKEKILTSCPLSYCLYYLVPLTLVSLLFSCITTYMQQNRWHLLPSSSCSSHCTLKWNCFWRSIVAFQYLVNCFFGQHLGRNSSDFLKNSKVVCFFENFWIEKLK